MYYFVIISTITACLVFYFSVSVRRIEKFPLHIVSGLLCKDSLINRFSLKLISCENEARGSGVLPPRTLLSLLIPRLG